MKNMQKNTYRPKLRKTNIFGGYLLQQKVKNIIFFQNCRSIFVYSAKNKNRRGDQIPPKEISICGEKRTSILFGSHVARPRNCQLKRRSAESQKVLWSLTSNMVRGLSGQYCLQIFCLSVLQFFYVTFYLCSSFSNTIFWEK